jgi:hypothetical protein
VKGDIGPPGYDGIGETGPPGQDVCFICSLRFQIFLNFLFLRVYPAKGYVNMRLEWKDKIEVERNYATPKFYWN